MATQFALFQQLLVHDSDNYNEAHTAQPAPKGKKRQPMKIVPVPEEGALQDGDHASGDRQPAGAWRELAAGTCLPTLALSKTPKDSDFGGVGAMCTACWHSLPACALAAFGLGSWRLFSRS